MNEDDIPDASELLDFELIAKSQPDKGQGLWLWVVLVLVLAGGGWAGWLYLKGDTIQSASPDGVPTLMSPKFALKDKPSDPGGMNVPDRDKLVYDRMAGDGNVDQGVERLLPPPETPLEPPAAAPQSSAPQSQGSKVVVDMPPAAPQTPPQTVPQAEPKSKSSVAPTPAATPAPVAKVETPAASTPAVSTPPAAPVPPKTESATLATNGATPVFPSTGQVGKGYLVQLSAVRTEEAAKSEWARLVKANADVLGGLKSVILRADLGTKGIFYRVRGGWFASRAEAKAICDELARRNVGCIIAKP